MTGDLSSVRIQEAGRTFLRLHFGQAPPEPWDDFIVFRPASYSKQKACFVLDHGNDIVYASGYNGDGRLATGDKENIENGFKKIDALSGQQIVEIQVGFDHILALKANGQILSWGSNEFGQLGDDKKCRWNYLVHPQLVKFGDNDVKIVSIAAGNSRSFAVSREGIVYEWGFESYSPTRIHTEAIGPVTRI